MTFQSPIPAYAVVIERGEMTIRVGADGDLTWRDVKALRRQHADRAEPLSVDVVMAILNIKRVFPDASVANL